MTVSLQHRIGVTRRLRPAEAMGDAPAQTLKLSPFTAKSTSTISRAEPEVTTAMPAGPQQALEIRAGLQ